MKKKIIVAAKNPAPPAPKPWWDKSNFEGAHWSAENTKFLEMKERLSDWEINALWREFNKKDTELGDKRRWLRELGIEYALQAQGQLRAEGEVTDLIARRWKMAVAFDVAALKKESQFFDPRYNQTGGSDTMAKTKGSKEVKEKRVTAASVLIPLLSAAKVKDDEELIERVKDATGSTKFDKAQLAWYKWKFREGKLKGMDGKKHAINQGSPLKKKAQDKADKAAKKKIVVKRAKKEPVEIAE